MPVVVTLPDARGFAPGDARRATVAASDPDLKKLIRPHSHLLTTPFQAPYTRLQ